MPSLEDVNVQLVILGSTDRRAPSGFAPIAIGLALTLIHLVGDPRDEHLGEPGPQQPPRPSSSAGWALGQLWLFWLAPIVGAAAAGALDRWLGEHDGQ